MMKSGFLVIFSMTAAGLAGLGVWAPALGGLALHLTVADRYWSLWQRTRELEREPVATRIWGQSVLQNFVFAGLAYALGVTVQALFLP